MIFQDMLSDGYDGALHLSLGRVIEVSVAAMRLVLSGTMERHPDLKIVMSHTGGSLPYQSGRMDKNSKAAKLPKPVSTYLKRMYSDTVSPHSEGMKFAIDYYGIDHVMYGTDYPCWDPATALRLIDEIGLIRRTGRSLLQQRPSHPRPARRGAAASQTSVREPVPAERAYFLRQSNPVAAVRALRQGTSNCGRSSLSSPRASTADDDELAGPQPPGIFGPAADLDAQDLTDSRTTQPGRESLGARLSCADTTAGRRPPICDARIQLLGKPAKIGSILECRIDEDDAAPLLGG
jgi:hypothetical protein